MFTSGLLNINKSVNRAAGIAMIYFSKLQPGTILLCLEAILITVCEAAAPSARRMPKIFQPSVPEPLSNQIPKRDTNNATAERMSIDLDFMIELAKKVSTGKVYTTLTAILIGTSSIADM